ncbi:MAG: hypothetical protein AAF724_22745 [Pseudomonadota bacterium]
MTYHDTTPPRAPVPISPLAILGDLSAIEGFSSIQARTLLEDHITACMGILDALDGDADYEPSLGSLEQHPNVHGLSHCNHLRWGYTGARELELDESDLEPYLGWTISGQIGGVFDTEDDGDCREPDELAQ